MDFIKSVRKVSEVLDEIRHYVKHRPRIIRVHVESASGRILASDVVSLIDVPPYDRAVVDGYAVRAEDTFSASSSSPVILRLVRKSKIESGEAVEVAVGDPLPEGANAVIMREHVILKDSIVEVIKPAQEYLNVSRRGEDFRKGEVIISRGKVLDLIDIAAAVSCGHRELEVFDLRAALICTGSELKDIDDISGIEDIRRGVVPNTTKYIIEWFLSRLGVKLDYLGLVPDDEELIAEKVEHALDRYDLVITTGGLAVSARDLTYRAVERLKPEYIQRGLAIRPGRPTSIAVIRGKPVLMLSGFPLAALTGLYYVAPRVLEYLLGCKLHYYRVLVPARLATRITKPPHLRTLVRARLRLEDKSLVIEPLATTGSGLLSTLLRGNALIDVAEGLEGHDENEIVISELLRGA